MFSNTNRKIHKRKQLASKVIQIYTQSNSTKKSFHVPSGSPQNQTSWFKIAIIGDENITTSIYLAVQTLSLSKAIGSCAQKAKILVVTVEFRRNNLPLIMISDPGQLHVLTLVYACSGVPQVCGCERESPAGESATSTSVV